MIVPFTDFACKADTPFVPRSAWPEFPLEMSVDPFLKPVKKGDWIRFGIFPFILHVYVGDKEPPLLGKSFFPRLYVWDRVERIGDEDGWMTIRIPQTIYAVAYFDTRELFFGRWSSTYRWKRNRWLKEKEQYFIEEVTIDVFLKEYKKSSTYLLIPKSVIQSFIESIHSRCCSKLYTHILFIREKATNKVLSGAIFEYSLKTKNTHYLCGFIQDHKEKRPVMIGLFDEWATRGEALGMKWYNYGVYVHSGTDKSKEGFSQFKSGLGVSLYQAPFSVFKVSRK